MKEEIKNPETSVEYITSKQWKPILSVVKKIQASEKINKIEQCFYQIVLFVAGKNRIL